jgi:methanogenic corrinoid protein MtbC1
MNELGRNIKHLRSQEKYSQKELAELLGVSQTSVAHYEAGTRQPTIETLMALSQIFNETIDVLVGHTHEVFEGIESDVDEKKIIELMVASLINKEEREFFNLFENDVLPNFKIAVIIDVIFKHVLYEIGNLWMIGEITEADEHYATNMIRKTMNYLSVKNVGAIKDKMAVSFSVSSEKHTLGIEMVNTYLETLGIKTIYLGGNLPVKSLDKVIEDYKPKYVFISITLYENINSLTFIVDHLNEKFPNEFLIAIGGQGLLYKANLEQHSNVYFVSNLSELEKFVEM